MSAHDVAMASNSPLDDRRSRAIRPLDSADILQLARRHLGFMPNGAQIAAEEAGRLRHWVLLANAKGRYSRGSSESLLDQDLATLRQDGGANELIDRLRAQVGRLDIAPEELAGC